MVHANAKPQCPLLTSLTRSLKRSIVISNGAVSSLLNDQCSSFRSYRSVTLAILYQLTQINTSSAINLEKCKKCDKVLLVIYKTVL